MSLIYGHFTFPRSAPGFPALWSAPDASGDPSSPLVSAIGVLRSVGDMGSAAAVPERNYQIRLDININGPPNSQFIVVVRRDQIFCSRPVLSSIGASGIALSELA